MSLKIQSYTKPSTKKTGPRKRARYDRNPYGLFCKTEYYREDVAYGNSLAVLLSGAPFGRLAYNPYGLLVKKLVCALENFHVGNLSILVHEELDDGCALDVLVDGLLGILQVAGNPL